MSQQNKRNLYDDGVFKPLADIGQGKTMRLRLGIWKNTIQFSTKINDQYVNLALTLSDFGIFEDWVAEIPRGATNRNLVATLRKGRDNQAYGQLAFGVGEDGIWYIGCADTSGTRVKHRFIPSTKFNYAEDGKAVPDADMSRRLVANWFKNVRTLLPAAWNENYQSPDELAYKPNGGAGGYGGGNSGGGYGGGQRSGGGQPALDFDNDIAF